MASGEVILAVAVLSIILTAPLGAIAIKIFGEKVLDRGEHSVYRFKEVREKLELPRVGQRLRNKDSGKLWKVIEEKEMWLDDPGPVPSIYLRLWNENSGDGPGTGKTMAIQYKPGDQKFDTHWEILYDW